MSVFPTYTKARPETVLREDDMVPGPCPVCGMFAFKVDRMNSRTMVVCIKCQGVRWFGERDD